MVKGKQFERVIKAAFGKVKGVSVDRLHDQMSGFKGSTNISDLLVFKKPNLYYIECKTVQGNTFSIHSNDPKRKYGNITNNQWEGLLEKSNINGIVAGVIIWWIDKDVTLFIDIRLLEHIRRFREAKSVICGDFDEQFGYTSTEYWYELKGKKKRVFFDYDMKDFLNKMKARYK